MYDNHKFYNSISILLRGDSSDSRVESTSRYEFLDQYLDVIGDVIMITDIQVDENGTTVSTSKVFPLSKVKSIRTTLNNTTKTEKTIL